MTDDRITTIREAHDKSLEIVGLKSPSTPGAMLMLDRVIRRALESLAADLAAAETRATEADRRHEEEHARWRQRWDVAAGHLSEETRRANEWRRGYREVEASLVKAEAERDATVARANTLAALLDEYQWNGYSWIGMMPCICCGGPKPKHASDCQVAATLGEARDD